jgi:glutamate dehydrogenase
MTDKSTIQDFKTITRDQFMVEYQCDDAVLEGALNSIFRFFQNGNFTKFKVEIDVLSDELFALKIIAKDAAFIVDSIMNLLQKNSCEIVFMSIPVFSVWRNNDGILESFSELNNASNNSESISLFVCKGGIQIGLEQLKIDTEQVLECVFAVNEAWLPSQTIVKQILNLEQDKRNKKFFEWLLHNNFIFLATCNGDWNGKIENLSGLLSTKYYNYKDVIDLNTGEIMKNLPDQTVLFERTTTLSKVHRNANMDVIYVRNPENTQFISLVGFFTSAVYHQNVMDIPIINDKIRSALAKYTKLVDSGYVMKEVIAQMQEYPRTELFQMNNDDLYSLIGSIISVILLPRVKIFAREDITSGFKSILIFIPQNKFSMDLYSQIEEIVRDRMAVRVFKKYIHMSEGKIMNVQLIVKQVSDINYNLTDIEKAVESVTWSWHDLLREGLYRKYKHSVADEKLESFSSAFPAEYIASNKPNDAIEDISVIDNMFEKTTICKFLVDDNGYHFRIYSNEYKLEVSDLLPAIENAGFAVTDMITHKLTVINKTFFIHKIDVRPNYNINIQRQDELKQNLEVLIEGIISNKHSDDDRFNSLILSCGLSYREVLICRIYASYTKQLALHFDREHIVDAFIENPLITRRLVDLFNQKFSKIDAIAADLEVECINIKEQILFELDKVENALYDRILRGYLVLIDATKRTNFFCNYEYISLKIASTEIPFAPLPKPFMEIFVYSNQFEGIHLRGGKVARGGIRWSDRHMDFRTEVLGLMKAQMTKNSVIVPVGSKGGFIVKNVSPKNRDSFLQAGIECYKLFLRGLLDITDNFIGSKVIQTKNSVCWDDMDPYLVVAADKGTATFSDDANAMALEYNFWLGDAFASGGSAGYDHKKLAITSRGAWISVLQHFKMLGINPNEDEIRVIGIGDMSGDVFGNGLLLSKKICLVAAFNHMHIFIDPKPDCHTSYNERKRLFDKPRSQWSDYNLGLISKGGGIFLRSAKSIEINDDIRSTLGIDSTITHMTPDDLIQAILKSPVDLMWNGGIGTYVKSSSESNEQIGDKSNDNLRVNGIDLKCKVVAEGGNLGFTQLGRVEYATIGGYINTDAIDNSGGVDCSDHEVNLKIALSRLLSDGQISLQTRNQLLESMSNEVCELVLNDNRLQNQILSVELSQGKENIAEHCWLVDNLEKSGELNRDVEKLPSRDDFHRMIVNKHSLTRPELAVLLAYAKNSAINILSEIEGFHEMFDKLPYKNMYLKYFPLLLREDPQYLEYLFKHRLSKEILVTIVVNDLINTMGCTYFYLRVVRQGISPMKLIKAFCIVKYGLKIDETLAIIEKTSLPTAQVFKLHRLIQSIIARNIAWISHGQLDEIDVSHKLYEGISTTVNTLIKSLGCKNSAEMNFIKDTLGVEEISGELQILSHTLAVQRFALDIFFASQKYCVDVVHISKTYDLLRLKLRFDILYRNVGKVFYSLNYESKIATMIVMRGLDSLLMKLTVAFVEFIGMIEIEASTIDKLHEICPNDSLNKYFEFIDEIYDWSGQDIVSLLLLLKTRMKAILNSIRNELLQR